MSVVLGPVTTLPAPIGAGPDPAVARSSRQPDTQDLAKSAAGFANRLARETSREVNARRTPITAPEARRAIGDAYTALTGEVLSDGGQDILTAQWAHETGNGASMYNFNFGGIKGTGPSGLTVTQRTREGYGNNERQIRDSFRAYANAEEGARDYVQLLLSRYGSAVNAAQQGDASGFVRGLKERGYFTGDPAAYERSIASLAQRMAGTTEPMAISASAPTSGGASHDRLRYSPSQAATRAVTGHQLGSRILADLSAPLNPTALLDLSSSGSSSQSGIDSVSQLSAARALEMQDEITRAALRIAIDNSDGDGDGSAASG